MDCLRTHKDSVHEGKKYRCDICEKHVSQKEDLRRDKDSFDEDKNIDVISGQYILTYSPPLRGGNRKKYFTIREGKK